jgi:hypothetical protein
VRIGLATLLGFGLLAALPAHADNGLELTCITRGLAPGATVWMDVEAQYQRVHPSRSTANRGFHNSAQPEGASDHYVWRLTVPANGEATPGVYRFEFPVEVTSTEPDRFGAIYLKTRFRIDESGARKRAAAYGEVHEVTLAMSVPPGAVQLSRCMRLREVGDDLKLELAADCRDSSFAKSGQGGTRLHVTLPKP